MNKSWSVSKRNGLKCRLGNKAVMLLRRHLIEAAPSLLSLRKALMSTELPFLCLKAIRTNWNVLRCYIVIVSCLSDSG